MDTYEKIEQIIANDYGKEMTSKKSIGDFMMDDDHAVNVKSNNLGKSNYSPNMISIKKMHKWVFEECKKLSFVFVDYKMTAKGIEIIKKSELIPLEHISWECLSIEAQGYGVIQKNKELKIDKTQTRSEFYKGFLAEYEKFRQKESNKHAKFSKTFLSIEDVID